MFKLKSLLNKFLDSINPSEFDLNENLKKQAEFLRGYLNHYELCPQSMKARDKNLLRFLDERKLIS